MCRGSRSADALPEDGQGLFSLCSTLVPWALEVCPDGEWITAWTDETLLLSLKETAFGVIPLGPVWLNAATEEEPVFPLDLLNPVSMVVLCNPESFGHVWFRRPLVAESQPSLGEGPA